MKLFYTLIITALLPFAVSAQVVNLTFEGDTLPREDFNGSVTTVIDNPDQQDPNTTDKVAQNFVPSGAEFAGSITPITVDLAEGTLFTVQVWSPIENAPVLLKLEVQGDGMPAVQKSAIASGPASSWQTLTFDFAGEEIRSYPNITLFMNFNVVGTEDLTFFYDNIVQSAGMGGGGDDSRQVDLPITFDDDGTDYDFIDFEGLTSSVVEDPTMAGNNVASLTKEIGAATFAGTILRSESSGTEVLANPIALSADANVFTMRFWSPVAGTPVHLKLENELVSETSVQMVDSSTVAMGWDTLTFDARTAIGTAVDYDAEYSKLVVFPDFGSAPTEATTYYVDDIIFTGNNGMDDGGPVMEENNLALPLTFEDDSLDYGLIDFNGTASTIVADPTDSSNTVVQTIKLSEGPDLQTFAGTVVANGGLAAAIPFTETMTTMTVRVWSPTVGIPVRLKLETAGTPTVFVETDVLTTVAMQWDTLSFDFSNTSTGTVLDPNAVYDQIAIFFDFGTTPDMPTTYYWDDITLEGLTVSTTELPVANIVKAYPNPVADRLTLTAPERMGQVTLYSIDGAVMGNWVANAEQFDLDMTTYAPGIYVAIVTAGNRAYSVKVLRK